MHLMPSSSRYWSIAAWCGTFALALLWACAAAVLTLFITFNGDEHPESAPPRFDIMVVYFFLVGMPAIFLWKGGGASRGAAVVLGGCWVAGVLLMFWSWASWRV
jgi:hypothetical protein